MSAAAERGALTPGLPLYVYALRLHRAEPDGRLPKGGYALPDPPERRRRTRTATNTPWKVACAALAEVLGPLMSAPDTDRAAEEIHLRLAEPNVRAGHVQYAVAGLPLQDEASARALGRCLARTGTSTLAVSVGIALLARLGEPEDIPYLKVLGQLQGLFSLAVQALDAIDSPTAALVWLGHRAGTPALRGLVDALAAGADASVRERLEAVLRETGSMRPQTARRVAEAVRLAEVLREADPHESWPVAGAGRLLCRMSSANDDRAEILACPAAVSMYEAFVARAAELPPAFGHYAVLLSVALELHSGPSHLLEWGTGRREALLDGLEAVLSRPAWRALPVNGEGRRAEWARRTARQPFRRDSESAGSAGAAGSPGSGGSAGPVGRLRVEATVLDPVDPGIVETRILIDGRPLVPEAFGRGLAHSPEYLLDAGRLRATDEPRKVQLAEAYCTEGCCGALHVTIRRDGDHVVWSDWSRPAPPSSSPLPRELPEYRFEAAAYDAEITRAENDHSWTWPARRTARLIAAGLRDRPDLLTRWGAKPNWVGTDFRDRDLTAVSLLYRPDPGVVRSGEYTPWKHCMWYIPEDGTPPEDRAAAALHRLATADPRTYDGGAGGG
ncbi:hypothetical protein GCM10015535_45120 [Streptomyces gelaticus]|uniref:HEAT repeat domain-containing protein n=1 Tax=Streptomyces gelaticus TaxID=285446 RepID=A0ABQ2W2E0_9ACTN|nr:hypothetical protein [Streptomyces gelaticus]GGV90032.1 hypothetical protein GCM10015535_45120 [Streptomyces gelaticus]